MPKQDSYKFPYDACFAGTRDQIEGLYVWKQRIIEALEKFRRELPKGGLSQEFYLKNKFHLWYSAMMCENLAFELILNLYHCTVEKPQGRIEINIKGRFPAPESLEGPNTGIFRLHF